MLEGCWVYSIENRLGETVLHTAHRCHRCCRPKQIVGGCFTSTDVQSLKKNLEEISTHCMAVIDSRARLLLDLSFPLSFLLLPLILDGLWRGGRGLRTHWGFRCVIEPDSDNLG